MKNILAAITILLRGLALIAVIGVRRLTWIRRQLLTVMSRSAARWLMLAVAVIAVSAEYFPTVPFTTLGFCAFLAFIVARRGKMRIGLGWLAILVFYEINLWAIFIIVPVEAFFGNQANVAVLVASAIHCVAFTYVAWDLAASPPPPRRKRERSIETVKTRFGWLNPLPAPLPVAAPGR